MCAMARSKRLMGINFEVERGEIIALLGANGAGKSSTLNALVGLVPTNSGEVTFDGAKHHQYAP